MILPPLSIFIGKNENKEGVSSMKPCRNSFVRWNNKGLDSRKEEKAARVLIDVEQVDACPFEKDLMITAFSV